MNRKKKINQTLKSKLKKMNAKLQNSSKPKYVSKAERAAIAAKEAEVNLAEGSDESTTETITESNTECITESNTDSASKSETK